MYYRLSKRERGTPVLSSVCAEPRLGDVEERQLRARAACHTYKDTYKDAYKNTYTDTYKDTYKDAYEYT
jgi:hypothetical protein